MGHILQMRQLDGIFKISRVIAIHMDFRRARTRNQTINMGIHIYRINFPSTKCSAQGPVYSHRFLGGPSGRLFIAVTSQQSKHRYSEKKSFHITSL